MREPVEFKQLRFMAGLGLPPRQVIPAMLDLVQRAIPCSFANMFWVDGAGRPLDAYAPWVIPSAMDTFIGRQAELRASPDEPTLDKLLHSPRDLDAQSAFEPARLRDTVIHNEVFRPYDVGHWLDLTLRDGAGRPLAIVILNREPRRAAFSAAEKAALWSLRDTLAAALSAADPDAPHLDWTGDAVDATGYLVIESGGGVAMAAGEAALLLSQFCGMPFAEGHMPLALLADPPLAVRALVRRAQAIADGERGPPAHAERNTPWGRISLRVHPESPRPGAGSRADARHIVALERRVSRQSAVLRNIAGLEVSPRERELAYFIGLGLPFETISDRMGLTVPTLRSYAKSIYAKLGADGRSGLEGRLGRLS